MVGCIRSLNGGLKIPSKLVKRGVITMSKFSESMYYVSWCNRLFALQRLRHRKSISRHSREIEIQLIKQIKDSRNYWRDRS